MFKFFLNLFKKCPFQTFQTTVGVIDNAIAELGFVIQEHDTHINRMHQEIDRREVEAIKAQSLKDKLEDLFN